MLVPTRQFSPRSLSVCLIVFSLWFLSACGALSDDKAPDYRYRLTVEVDTPEGLKTGSGVIEVERDAASAVVNPSAAVLRTRIRGEAVAVDLPSGQTLYALLRSEGGDVGWATRVVPFLSPDMNDDNPFDDVLLMKGKQELPRMWPPVGHLDERPAYPLLVTFADEADPTSVMQVDPDDLTVSFGKGVKLRRITAELTDDPVSTGIERRLGWLSDLWPNKLNGDRFEDFNKPDLAARLSPNSFSTEIGK